MTLEREPLAFSLQFLGAYSTDASYVSSPTVTNITNVHLCQVLRAGSALACLLARILFIRFLYAILVMPFVNTETIVKTAILRVSRLSLTRVSATLNDTLRVSKYFPVQPVSPSKLSLYFFSHSICLLFTARIYLLINIYIFFIFCLIKV